MPTGNKRKGDWTGVEVQAQNGTVNLTDAEQIPDLGLSRRLSKSAQQVAISRIYFSRINLYIQKPRDPINDISKRDIGIRMTMHWPCRTLVQVPGLLGRASESQLDLTVEGR